MPNDLIPISTEQAKAVEEAAKTVREALEMIKGLGGYFNGIVGTIPQDLVGGLVGDRLHAWRARNAGKIAEKASKLLDNRGVEDKETTGLSLGRALLDAAGDEDREELQNVWARLLAAAMDPSRSTTVRIEFVSIVKSLNPIDALVFNTIESARLDSQMNQFGPQVKNLTEKLGCGNDEIEISIYHLEDLKLLWRQTQGFGFIFTALGRELIRVLSD
jgi:hypothetical protein